MVLSNKKLKQKLRACIAESLTSISSSLSTTKPDSNDGNTASTKPDLNTQQQSLKQLLNSAAHKPRLSKREKKRIKILEGSSQDSETLNSKKLGGDRTDKEEKGVEDPISDGGDEGKGNRKRKRDAENSDEGKSQDLVESGDGENGEKKKRKKKEKKKKEDGEVEGEEAGKLNQAKNSKKSKNKKKKKKKNNKRKKNQNDEGKKGDEVVENGELNKSSDSQTNGYVATKVYVGGIPYYASEIDIRRYFEECGTITEVDCMTFPDTGKFRGIAIISFRTETAAKRALDLDGSEMEGMLLKIQQYKSNRPNKLLSTNFAPKLVEGYNRIYVGNLSWDITEDDLKTLFSDCKISSIRFGTDKETGEFKGFAHVDFSDSLSTTMALKLDQEVVCGRPVKISCAVPKKGGNTQSGSAPSITVVTDNTSDNADAEVVPGKIKRRKCYQCGEKGHLSSACPNKPTDPTNATTC